MFERLVSSWWWWQFCFVLGWRAFNRK
ncbi:hypothetical protein Gorai_001783 [Gossypium raimondii]|nr:hypothetical protein [Gossypium raimondii]